jgi:hypothetical protein
MPDSTLKRSNVCLVSAWRPWHGDVIPHCFACHDPDQLEQIDECMDVAVGSHGDASSHSSCVLELTPAWLSCLIGEVQDCTTGDITRVSVGPA